MKNDAAESRIERGYKHLREQSEEIKKISREITKKDKRELELRELEHKFYALVKEQILNYEKRIVIILVFLSCFRVRRFAFALFL